MAISIAYLLLALGSVRTDDLTYDEQDHLNYGISILKFDPSRNQRGRDFNTTMPITAFNALPRAVEQLENPILQKKDWGESDAKSGRYLTIAATLLLLFYIYFFARTLGGDIAGYFAMLVVAMDPNILAHSRLVTTDIYGTLAFIASFYHMFQWLEKKKQLHFLYWTIAIAVAQCCKVNNIILYPLSLVILIFYTIRNFRQLDPLLTTIRFFVFVIMQILVINFFFLFDNAGLSLDEIAFKSDFFQGIQKGWIGSIPVPFPQPYIQTFDLVQYERETFNGAASNYLFEELRNKQGFSNYYFIIWLFKTPLFTSLLGIATIAYLIYRRFNLISFIFYWALPVSALFIFLNNSTVQSGYRYLLPVLCLTAIPAGQTIAWLIDKFKKKWLPWLFVVVILLPALISYPNYLVYTNELILNKTRAYQYFADSNLSWGQRHKKIDGFLKEHPGYIFEPAKPVTGTIIVELNNLVGITDPEKFKWLRENFEPFDDYDGCYLLYKVDSLPVAPK